MKRWRTKTLGLAAVLLVPLVVGGTSTLAAADHQSGSIAQGYKTATNSTLAAGSLVSLKKSGSDTIELATSNNAGRLLGVVDRKPLVSITGHESRTQVAIGGATTALVSDINGAIASGDKLTASPIAGIGMKVTASGPIIGIAQSKIVVEKTTYIADKQGKKHQIHLGYVTLQVGASYYQAAGSSLLPPFVQNIADSLAGRPVSLVRALIAGLVLLIGLSSVIILVYGGVHSAITSIGRNPLAAKDIRRGLYQILLIAIIVAGGAALASYLVLRA
jgi:hypothetical protein